MIYFGLMSSLIFFKSQKYIAQNLKYKLIAHGVDARLNAAARMTARWPTSWMVVPPISSRLFCRYNTTRVRLIEKWWIHPQKRFIHSIKKISGLLILMQCIKKIVLVCLLVGEVMACGGLPFPVTGCPIPDVDNLCLLCIDFYVWDAVSIFQ